MSEAAISNDNGTQFESFNDSGGSRRDSLDDSIRCHDGFSDDERAVPVAAMEGRQPDDAIELLVSRFRDFLEAAPNPPTSDHTNIKRTTGRGRLFGLSKGLSPETSGLGNRFDYEQKYPRGRLGEELAPNARVWLTYLDEAEAYDRGKVEGWKETVDVLLVFAGLFSGVITAFISQASPSLKQDNAQVSASLLFEVTQLLRARFNGTSINNIPTSTLNPTSSFRPSTNAFLVNGLLFTSLAITLSTALFAVLAKQWLYYYLSSIPGTAHENVRARHLRFKGFELWKVGAIVDLLPILLHLAVGVFLTGIVILLFPLDVQVAWTIVAIAGTTYTLYFISVILPIRYPGCPYTTSLTIYVGVLFFILRGILRYLKEVVRRMKHRVIRKLGSSRLESISPKRIMRRIMRSIRTVLQYLYSLVPHAFFHAFGDHIRRGFRALRGCLSTTDFPKFTNWREENIRNAIKDAISLDYEALHWLHKTSSNTSIHRIIARCASVHPKLGEEFKSLLGNLRGTLEVNSTNVVDLRYALCLDLLCGHYWQFWPLLQSNPYVEGSQLEEAEYRSYSRIAENVMDGCCDQILKDALSDKKLELPLVMWRHFLANADGDAIVIKHILTYCNPFNWRPNPMQSTPNTGLVSFEAVLKDEGEPRQWIVGYFFHCFRHYDEPDYSSDGTFETCYLLLVSIYRDLTSDLPLIADEEQRQDSLYWLFCNFWYWLDDSKPRSLSPKQYLAFFRDILSVDAFWSESMPDDAIEWAVYCLDQSWRLMDTDVANLLPFMEPDDFSRIYQWSSRDLDWRLSLRTHPICTLLFMPQNRNRLRTILSNDPDAVSRFVNCLRNLNNAYVHLPFEKKIYPSLMDLFESVNRNEPGPLFMILYNPSVLVEAWRFLVVRELNEEKFFRIVVSKLGPGDLNDLFSSMNQEAQYCADSGFYICYALRESASEFGQLIRALPSNLESTTGNRAHEGGAGGGHDSEDLAQEPDENEHECSRSIFYRSAARFKSIWRKESVNETNNVELSEIRTG